MSVFKDILNLLTVSPGGMVYYLVLLFSIWAIVGLALSRWSRGERRGIVPRLLVAGALMSFGRLAFFVIALLDRTGGTRSTSYLIALGPPLERFLDALSVVLICWSVVIPPRQRTFSRVFIIIASILVVGLYLFTAVQWVDKLQIDVDASYNLFWQRWLWESVQLAFLVGAMVYLVVVPVPERGTLLIILGVLAGGHLLQAVLPFAQEIPHFASWVRFAHLLAFPLLAVIAFRLMVQRFDVQAASLQTVNQETLSQITGLMDLLDTNKKMSASLDLNSVLENAIRSVSQTLQSNLCAIALVNTGNDSTAELSILYRSLDTARNQGQFKIGDYPAIQHAITRGKPVVFESGENEHAVDVYQLLESEQPGSLIVQPLVYDSTVMGVILVGHPGQATPFSPVQLNKCETLSTHVALAVHNARAYQQMRSHTEQHVDKLSTLEVEHTRTKTDLENRLKQSQDEIALYVQKLYETELAEQRAQNDAHELRQQISKMKKVDQERAVQIRTELRKNMAQVASLTKKVSILDATRTELDQRMQNLKRENKALQSRLDQTQAEHAALKEHTQSMEHLPATSGSEQGNGVNALMLNSMPSGVIVCDTRGQITYLNPVAEQLLGYREKEWKGQEVASLWRGEEWQSAVHAVTDQYSAQTAPVRSFVVQHQTKRFQVALSPLHTEDRHIGAIFTLQDLHTVSERTRARDEFLASVSQELRTPMTSILGYTDLLMSESVGRLEGIQRKFLQRVQANIERMGGMLNDMIGVTAIDSGKLEIELEPVDIDRVIESALRKIQFRLEERELNTHLKIADPPTIYADPEHVQQMLDNLLTNACKSSVAGSTINVLAHHEMGETGQAFLHVCVSDTGGGVAPQDESRVFERFYRADRALIAGLGETGVGLAIVRALVEAHQGHIWIESIMGEGTTFHITLPYGLDKTIGNGLNTRIITQWTQ